MAVAFHSDASRLPGANADVRRNGPLSSGHLTQASLSPILSKAMPNSSNLAVPKSSTIVRASGCTWGSFISHHLAYRLPLPCQFTQDRLSQVAFRALLSSSILSVPKPLLGQRASCRIGAAILAFTRRISCVACWKLEVVAGRTCSDRKLNQTGRARYDHHKQLLEISHFTSPPHQSSQDYSARGNAFDIPLSSTPAA